MIRYLYILFTVTLLAGLGAHAQQGILNRIQRPGGMGGGAGGGRDSLKHRTGLEDSITINFRYLDSSRYQKFDSSINDFSKRFLLPPEYLYLGNPGSAAKSLLFSPNLKAGWDAGFHAFDVYRLRTEDTRFFNTTRPYTELGYTIASQQEQLVTVLHTQNINPNWNFAFQYRLSNSPGTFKNQNSSQNSYRLSSYYQSPNRRYHLFFIAINNKIQSAENGGLRNNADLDSLPENKDRKIIPVYLGPERPPTVSPFSTSVATGNKYKISQLFLRQQYDLGIKDSVQTDSVTIYLFYPKFRMEHTIQLNNYTYQFSDANVELYNDTGFYRPFYNFLSMPATYQLQDKWKETINDFSLYQFPDKMNAQQFFKVGASLQNLNGQFDGGAVQYHNVWLHGEYRNKTRNQKWDAEAQGELYLTGINAGDYSALGSLRRFISKQIGFLQVGFQNVNRTPSFIFNSASSFNLANVADFKKENTIRIFGSIDQPTRKLKLSANYYLVTNFSYFSDYYHAAQSDVFNLLQVSAEKEFRLRKHLQWILELTLQQRAGNGNVNVPLFYTRSRIGYQGNLGFKNLQLATGFEIKYNSAYKADGYSPLLGQFFYQDTGKVSLKLPLISAYFHFRVKRFTTYLRVENLNTVRTKNGFGFTNNNLAIDRYPYPGMQIRIGIFWTFVN
ncbi:MAG TPA: putative porin [Chitinophagaceae bacterium]|nr:putative porin [Chitinophagaceae bacterium]